MMVRLTSISGISGAPSRVTCLEYFETHSDSETILARTSCGSWLRSSRQSAGERAPQLAIPVDGFGQRTAAVLALSAHRSARR